MNNSGFALVISLVVLVVTTMAFPFVLRFAKRHNIVDNPNARKLQRIPIPVLGGVAVYIGVLTGVLALAAFRMEPVLLWMLLAMTVMLCIGVWDDITDLSPAFRLTVELLVVCVFMYATGYYMDDFHGLWGIHKLDFYLAVALSVVSGVGIINSVNLIDGVDGYASGYGVMACFCFSVMFWYVGEPEMVTMAMIMTAALLPFFMHNVFGIRSKMFMGDGGTLMLGTLMTIFLFYTISSKGLCGRLEAYNVGLEAFSLAVLCIPVFDTLRVMTLRMMRGRSPFRPDRTHLHHLFIDMGFSHLGAGLFILFINLLVVLAWVLLWQIGASIDVQTYVVALLGLAVTAGFYKFMKVQQNGGERDEDGYPLGTWIWRAFCRLGQFSHKEKGRVWRAIRYVMDSRVFGQPIIKK
jgi:UDP-N-acetylmuramyl pentapeptide phosphotransferase/UDP-N-acetylglucosamine-1-phosphate transferase